MWWIQVSKWNMLTPSTGSKERERCGQVIQAHNTEGAECDPQVDPEDLGSMFL
jgi:hypothetical protein